jgi:hypothetical protein
VFFSHRRIAARVLMLVLALGARGTIAVADEPAPPQRKTPDDFKIRIAFYGVDKEPITTAELVVHDGIAYRFSSEMPEEVLIFEPDADRLEFLDLERRVQAEIQLTKIEAIQKVLHKAIEKAIRTHEEAGGRADRLAAEMSRSLIDPRLDQVYDPAAHRLRMTNRVVTVEATGEPEPDAARLSLIEEALAALTKLDSVRDPKAIPPFIRLEALHALTAGHQLRPAEMTYVYRLSGPPRKHRWTYQLVDSLTPREIEALNRVISLRERTAYVPFERYEHRTVRPSP